MDASALLLTLQASTDTTGPGGYVVTLQNMFLLFFIMLGPIKALGPYFAATRALPPVEARRIALKVFALATISVVAGGLIGSAMLKKWQIGTPVMQLAGGLIFLLVALKMVMTQYDRPDDPPADGPPPIMRLVFPVTVTPYGIAALILLIAMSRDYSRTSLVIALVVAVMALNLLAMLFVRPIMRFLGPNPLQIAGAVLGVLQVALALQLIVGAMRGLRALPMLP